MDQENTINTTRFIFVSATKSVLAKLKLKSPQNINNPYNIIET